MKISPDEMLKKRFLASKRAPFFLSIGGETYTYSDLWFCARTIFKEWQATGLKKGDCIAFILQNSFSLPCLYLACMMGGFIACPIVKNLSDSTINSMLSRLNPALIVTEPFKFTPQNKIITASDISIPIDSEQIFLSIFTSGTTGIPKIIRHRLSSILASAAAFSDISHMGDETRIYHVLPMCYMAGILNTMFAPLMGGASIVEGPVFSPAVSIDFWSRPFQTDVNFLSFIPSIASSICKFTRDKKTIETIRERIVQVQCTSSPINPVLRSSFLDKFNIPLQDCYGITELGGALTLQTKEDAISNKEGGVPVQGLEIEIRGEGELWIRSPFAMEGYLEDGELISPFENGFMNTGDLASYYDGKVRITGRVKDIIIRGGINISPVKLENEISLMPDVEDIVVLGNEHEYWGEELIFCIIPKDLGALSVNRKAFRKAVLGWCRENLASSEQPDRIEIIDKFPRSFSGKVDKKGLRQQLVAS